MKFILSSLIFFSVCFSIKANVGRYRSFQLDSIVSVIDKGILKNLDSLHQYVDNHARSDEEKVFMYYGVVAIHYKYDKKRAKLSAKKSTEFTPYYTAYRRKGVCRDFAALIKELCDRSNIPCIVATGRSKVGFFKGISDFFLFKINDSNHAWNVIKYDTYWHIVDATWGYVTEVKKSKYKDKNGRVKKVKVKMVSRDYFDPMYEDVYNNRKSEHPALYAESKVYTYKSMYKKKEARIVLDSNFNYVQTLDSLSSNPFFKFSSEYVDSSKVYSDNSSAAYYYQLYHDFLKLKRSKYNKLTSADCKAHLEELDRLDQYLLFKEGRGFVQRYRKHRMAVESTMKKLILKEKK